MDARVQAIREHKLVGRGSCSSIDECMSDEELVQELDERKVGTADEAVKWAVHHEDLFLEQGLNQRWGEDSDLQLLAYNEFQTAKKNL